MHTPAKPTKKKLAKIMRKTLIGLALLLIQVLLFSGAGILKQSGKLGGLDLAVILGMPLYWFFETIKWMRGREVGTKPIKITVGIYVVWLIMLSAGWSEMPRITQAKKQEQPQQMQSEMPQRGPDQQQQQAQQQERIDLYCTLHGNVMDKKGMILNRRAARVFVIRITGNRHELFDENDKTNGHGNVIKSEHHYTSHDLGEDNSWDRLFEINRNTGKIDWIFRWPDGTRETLRGECVKVEYQKKF